MKKIIKKWKIFLTEAQYERPKGREIKGSHDRSLTGAEQLLRSGDVQAMFREELDQMLVSSYMHNLKAEGFQRIKRFLRRVPNFKREILLNDIGHIIEIYAADEQEKVRAGGWPMWIKRFTGKYSYHSEYDYEVPIYQTVYLGPSEEPSSVFNGQPIQVANENSKMEVLEEVKRLLEQEIELALRRSRATKRAGGSDMQNKEWVRSFYGLNVWRPEDVPETEPEPEPEKPRSWSHVDDWWKKMQTHDQEDK
tara:strand:- start:1117 stop:1869 length:753 start_codon:yes stop_codon:yes gene_type:complete